MDFLKRWLTRRRPLTDLPTIPLEDLRFIWNYQIVALDTTITIDLVHPLFDMGMTIESDLTGKSYVFPILVGEHGNLLAVESGRRVVHKDPSRTTMYLNYRIPQSDRFVELKVIGHDPQSIEVSLDQRTNSALPLILFLYKG